ncbi:S-layer homology domain-containing protein [Pseudarthrobacter equi]|uniref:S-layer homology domain-containing protein n=1 Tax=Pseudarthrobacter equi TaxID=728066 RepID=UPI0021BFCF0A|nr:S-layer homology domain-containing protein [Pseudarthrobacter equi]
MVAVFLLLPAGAPAQAGPQVTGTISGRVTSAAGLNVSRVLINVDGVSDRETWGSTYTKADGSYSVTGLPAGSYQVSVAGYDVGGFETWYGGSTTRELAAPVSLTAGQTVTGIDVDLLRGGTISGKVTVPAGYASDRIYVGLHGVPYRQVKTRAWTDGQGNYTLRGVAPGSYTVLFLAQSPDILPGDYGREPGKSPTVITVAGTDAITGIDIVLPRASILEGRLTVPQGLIPDRLLISARQPDGNIARNGTIAADGSYRITGLSGGSYRIKVSAGDSGMVDQWFSDGTPARLVTTVPVADEATVRGIDMTLAKAPAFSDVAEGAMFSQDIGWLAARGMTEGYPDNTFRPLNTIQRDAMAAFLYRASGRPDFTPPVQSPFRDVTPMTPFYKEITWFHATGITTGFPDGTFRPRDAVNRDAMAAFLRRFSNAVTCGDPDRPTPYFADNPKGGQFAADIDWMACFAISTGYPDGTYRPGTPVNRDAMAAFLQRWSVSYAAYGTPALG